LCPNTWNTRPGCGEKFIAWHLVGRMQYRFNSSDRVNLAPSALSMLFSGANTGKGSGKGDEESHLSHDIVVHPFDSRGSHQAVAGTRICGRSVALAKRHVGSVEPERLPVTSGDQGQTPKKAPETDTIFANIQKHDRACQGEAVMRLSVDCKATVNIGDYSRGGKTRGDNKAADHDMGCEEKHTPLMSSMKTLSGAGATNGVHASTDCVPVTLACASGRPQRQWIADSPRQTKSGSLREPLRSNVDSVHLHLVICRSRPGACTPRREAQQG
jgi:hypothetical protein